MKNFIFFFIFFFALLCLSARKNEQTLEKGQFSTQQLLDDLDSLYADIKDIHPNMYANISKQEFDAEFQKIRKSIILPMDVTEFYDLVAPLLVMLRDGHTSLVFTDSIYRNTDKLLFPFWVEVPNDSTLVIAKNLSEEKNIPVNAIINSINSIPSKELIKTCLNYASGEMIFYRLSKIPYRFTNMLWQHYNFEHFEINYTYNDTVYTHKVKGISYADRYATSTGKSVSNDSYSFKIVDGVGIIDFSEMIDLTKFENFTDSIFKILKDKSINNLIIDVRYNSGGNSRLGDNLFQYISPVPFNQFGKTIVKYSKGREYFYRNHLRDYFMPEASDSLINEIIGDKPYGTIDTLQAEKPKELIVNPFRYKGNTYLLISHITFSSAASFAWAFKYFGMGKVVGEESGGAAVSYGDVIIRWLPNTGLRYILSHKMFYQYGATDENFHGTIPDYEVPAKNAMEYTMKLINK